MGCLLLLFKLIISQAPSPPPQPHFSVGAETGVVTGAFYKSSIA